MVIKYLKMTKRSGSFNTENNNKKQKVDDDFNDLWGEDLDVDDIDDCITLATQVCQQEKLNCTQRNNVSILPTYNAFKQNENFLFTSTQNNNGLNMTLNLPSTSNAQFSCFNGLQKNIPSSNKLNLQEHAELQIKMHTLQGQYEAKEGEASILRSQLKQLKIDVENEQLRKEQAWEEKLNVTRKEMCAVKSELEFKNLEIANLKTKITEVTKFVNSEITLNPTQKGQAEEQTCRNTVVFKSEAIIESSYPLALAISSTIFNRSNAETYADIIYNKLCKNNQYLQKDDSNTVSQLKKITDNSRLTIDCVYSDISTLMKCTTLEINLEKCHCNINKIIYVTKCFVQNFHDYLVILEDNMTNENIRQLDTMYLEKKVKYNDVSSSIFDSKKWTENEIGIKPRQMIAVVSETLLYSNYLRGYLLENKPLVPVDEDFLKYEIRDERNKFDFLYLLLSVINIIGKTRKAEICVGFLCAVSVLLTKICLTSQFDTCYSLVLNIAKQIIFARPSSEVIKYLSIFFKEATINKNFVEQLCSIPSTRSLKINSKEGIILFNQDSCVLQVFTALYEDNYVNNGHINLDINLNMMQFITNLLNSNILWLHYQENSHCDCLCKINNLSIEIIYETMNVYRKEMRLTKPNIYPKHKEILRYSIKILHILNFKSFDLINKYLTVYSQYKSIVKSLLDYQDDLDIKDSDLEALQNLNIHDEMPEISNKIFENIPLWN